jgi:putative oxidoreductase
MLTHGYGKFMKVLSGDFSFGDPIGIGSTASLILCAFAEFIVPILMIVGWKTRWFSLIAAINMLVALLIAHDGDPFAKKEKAFLYLIIFVFIYFSGAGKYSVDKH